MARGDLEEILAALVIRARHAISDAGRIVIETRDAAEAGTTEAGTTEAGNVPPQRGVIIQLTDTGAGIDADTRAGLEFDAALRHDVAADNRVPLLVGRAGGRVSVECDAVLGTTVRVYLPVIPAASRP
jgi:hypothetical protein